jgi:hypothetical protein
VRSAGLVRTEVLHQARRDGAPARAAHHDEERHVDIALVWRGGGDRPRSGVSMPNELSSEAPK